MNQNTHMSINTETARNNKPKSFNRFMLDANMGIEKECLRVVSDGQLASSPHPFPGDPHIDRDFSENQLEFVTDIYDTPGAVYKELYRLHQKAARTMQTLEGGPEFMWPFSNPPRIEPGFINNVAQFDGDNAWKTNYRKHLRKKYGSRLMLYSGIHFNFSFTDEFFSALFKDFYGAFPNENELHNFKTTEYLNMAAWAVKYSWLIVYLMSASSVADESFFDIGASTNDASVIDEVLHDVSDPGNGMNNANTGDGALRDADDGDGGIIAASARGLARDEVAVLARKYSSPRTSEIGYWNNFSPVLDYSDLNRYVDSIERYVKDGAILIPSELYYPVRLKSRGVYDLDRLREEGVSHIEIRIMDLNPYSPVGVIREDMQFLHLLMVYLIYREPLEFVEALQIEALRNIKLAAVRGTEKLAGGEDIARQARELICEIDGFFRKGAFSRIERAYIRETIDYQLDKLKPGRSYADRVAEDFGDDYARKGLALARAHASSLL